MRISQNWQTISVRLFLPFEIDSESPSENWLNTVTPYTVEHRQPRL